jgi:hypothetical protein
MTLISKLAISLFISVTSIFILKPPPAPTADDLAVRQLEVFEGYGRPVDIPSTTSTVPVTTPITQPDACQTVFDMARHVGWAEQDLTQLVAVAYRESRCMASAHNTTLNRDKSSDIGVMQINDKTWCKPSKYWPNGYLQAYGLLRNCDDLFDLETNLRSALAIFRYSNGWRAWSL